MAASSPTRCAAVPSEARHSWSARSDQDSPKLIKMHDFASRPIQSQKCVQNPISKNLTKLARGPLAHESASVIPLPVVPLLLSLFWLTVRLVLTLDNVDTKKNPCICKVKSQAWCRQNPAKRRPVQFLAKFEKSSLRTASTQSEFISWCLDSVLSAVTPLKVCVLVQVGVADPGAEPVCPWERKKERRSLRGCSVLDRQSKLGLMQRVDKSVLSLRCRNTTNAKEASSASRTQKPQLVIMNHCTGTLPLSQGARE